MSVNRLIFVGLSGGMIVLISFLTTCQSSTEEVSNITEGERLARIRCASCHLFPEPALLSQSAWENGVLPQMAYYFGLITKNRTPYKNISIEEYQNLKQSGVFPDEPSISKEEWAAIRDYYLSNAPEQPALIDHKISAPAALNLFTPQPIHLRLKEGPLTTMVHFDSQGQNIYISDLRDTLYKVDINGKVQSKTKLLSLISDMSVREDNTQYLLAMGNIHPKDNPLGHLLYRDISGNISSIMEGLHRPVDI